MNFTYENFLYNQLKIISNDFTHCFCNDNYVPRFLGGFYFVFRQ